MAKTGDRCESCQVGRLYTYKSKTGAAYIVRYLRCRACGHRPADNKLVLPLAMARKIIGQRKNRECGTQRHQGAASAGYNRGIMGNQFLITRSELCSRLGVGELDYISAEHQGRVPQAVVLNFESDSEPRYSWPHVLAWLEDGCPVVRPDLWALYVAENGDRLKQEMC